MHVFCSPFVPHVVTSMWPFACAYVFEVFVGCSVALSLTVPPPTP